jgi:hypothetical protein
VHYTAGNVFFSHRAIITSLLWIHPVTGEIELIKYHRPSDENGIQQPLANANANTLGIRHMAYGLTASAVEDIEARVPFRELLPISKRKGRKPSVRYMTLKACIIATFKTPLYSLECTCGPLKGGVQGRG